MNAKLDMVEKYPYIANFAIQAFLEKNREVSGDIQASYREIFHQKAGQVLARIDPGDFRPGLDLQMMYRQMFLASEGYLWEMAQQGGINRQQLRQDFEVLLAFWKKAYCREENT